MAATVTYDPATLTGTLTPTSPLAPDVGYTAKIDGTVKAADGTAISGATTWSWVFSTSTCPCNLFSDTLTPAVQGLPVQDGRSGSGPFSYELGVKITNSQPVSLRSIRFYKTAGENGTHIGKIWSAGGTQLASVTFANETASGWQTQTLATPLALDANTVYVVSANINAFFSVTSGGLATSVGSGPLSSVADGNNGVYGASAGTFPTQSASSTNYFVDASVVPNGAPSPLTVSSTSPAANASGVLANTTITATFSRALDPATVNGSTFTLQTSTGSPVAAGVTYNSSTNTAVLTPSALLSSSTAYTAPERDVVELHDEGAADDEHHLGSAGVDDPDDRDLHVRVARHDRGRLPVRPRRIRLHGLHQPVDV